MKRKYFLLMLMVVLLFVSGCQQRTPLPTFPPPFTPTSPAGTPGNFASSTPTLTHPTETSIPEHPTLAPSPAPSPTFTLLPPSPTPLPTSTPLPPSPTPPPTPTVGHTPTPQPTPLAFEELTQPWNLVGSYINAINRREFRRAYGYFDSTDQSYEDFVKGFSNTAHVTAVVWPPTWIEGAAGSFYASVPTILVATNKDGSEHFFAGCYVERRTNPAMSQTPTSWGFIQHETEMHAVSSPNGWQLEHACSPDLMFPTNEPFDDQSDPIATLSSYVNAVNLRDYHRAYGYWESPNQSYEDFVQGFADTRFVILAVRVPYHEEGAAGSFYAEIQTLLLAIHKDGSKHSFVGCYAMRTANPAMSGHPEEWKIYWAKMAPSPGNSGDVRLLHSCG